MEEEMDDHIGIIVGADIVQTDVTREIRLSVESIRRFGRKQGEGGELSWVVAWVQDRDDIL
jgi:hypothetical protein